MNYKFTEPNYNAIKYTIQFNSIYIKTLYIKILVYIVHQLVEELNISNYKLFIIKIADMSTYHKGIIKRLCKMKNLKC